VELAVQGYVAFLKSDTVKLQHFLDLLAEQIGCLDCLNSGEVNDNFATLLFARVFFALNRSRKILSREFI
jgi:hypothetical protein